MLRPSIAADIAALVALRQDPDIVRWTRVPAGYTAQDATDRIPSAGARRRERTALNCAVIDAETAHLLGAIQLVVRGSDPGSDPGIAKVVDMLGASTRGRGVMVCAVRLVAGYAFDQLAVRRIELLHHPDNARSVGVARRAGFHREGLLSGYRTRRSGAVEDRVPHALLACDLSETRR